MTLKDFVKITWRITNDIYRREYWRPDAICVSRKIFNDLAEEARDMVIYARQAQINADAQVCGLKLFVDDDMPDDYYQIGYMKDFIGYFERKQKQKKIEGD